MLLAAMAACVDNCRPLSCPRNRTLNAVLHASLYRGRDYGSETSGALEFFVEVQQALDRGLNPFVDSVFETSVVFAPELAFLNRENEAYGRDLQRGRRTIVQLQEATAEFEAWFPQLMKTVLVNPDNTVNQAHLQPPHMRRMQTDGIYIRDPECMLFKEWARADRENSSMGEGFVFTAIAYSRGRPGLLGNETDYWFTLDPERAGRRHLYNVWARLQAAEVKRFLDLAKNVETFKLKKEFLETHIHPRPGFEERGGSFKAYFKDPWFDGHNYRCTIVATPGEGSCLGPSGRRGDLSDDPVAQLVEQELEYAIFSSSLSVQDLAAQEKEGAALTTPVQVSIESNRPLQEGSYRFATCC